MKQDNSIKLSDIINHKGGSLEDLISWASSIGLKLPNDPDYVLTPSELKTVDPILAFNLRSSKTLQPRTPQSKEIGIQRAEQPIILQAIKTDNKNEKRDTRQTQKNKNNIIGVVKFFIGEKNYGFINSNNKGFETENEEYSIKSIHFNRSEKYLNPNEGDFKVYT